MGSRSVSSKDEQMIVDGFSSKSSSERRKIAKVIGKQRLRQLSSQLLTAYLMERKDPRTWQTQAEMIKALGRIDCKEALPYLYEIVKANVEYDTITIFAATSYIRMKTEDPSFFTEVAELLKNGNHSVRIGVLRAFMFEKIKLDFSQMKEMIDIVEDLPKINEVGVENIHERMACVMASWPMEWVEPTLKKYLDEPGIHKVVVEHALKGKVYGPKEY